MNSKNKINITFPDGKTRSYDKGISCLEIANSISEAFSRKLLLASINNIIVVLSYNIYSDSEFLFYTWDCDIGKSAFWLS